MNNQNRYYPKGSNGMYVPFPETSEEKIKRLIAEIGDRTSIPNKIANYNEIISISQAAIASFEQQSGGKRRKAKKTRKTRSK